MPFSHLNPWNRPQLGVFVVASKVKSLQPHVTVWRQFHAAQIAIVHNPLDEILVGELDRLDIPGRRRIYHLDSNLDPIRSAALWKGWQEGLTHFVMIAGEEPSLALRAMLDQVALDPDVVCVSRSAAVFPHREFTKLADFEGDMHDFLLAQNSDRVAFFEGGNFPVLHDDDEAAPAFYEPPRPFSRSEESACPA